MRKPPLRDRAIAEVVGNIIKAVEAHMPEDDLPRETREFIESEVTTLYDQAGQEGYFKRVRVEEALKAHAARQVSHAA